MVILAGGIGYGIYRTTGEVVAEALILEGQTLRVGGLTQRKVLEKDLTHTFTIAESGKYTVYLEGYFPNPTKSVGARNNYTVTAVTEIGQVLFAEEVSIRFKRKKEEGAQQLIGYPKPGLTKKKVATIELLEATTFEVTLNRGKCDTTANQLYLRVRKNRG